MTSRLHPLQRRYYAEDLVRPRSSDEQRRYLATQRSGRIDPNPHQIDAVIFALKRIPEGGCVLADEVGLGKTIEAGLVIAQLLAEGAERVLLIVPKALLGQWREELFTLFNINAVELAAGVDPSLPGVYLATRDLAGSERGAEAIGRTPPFDLCVIDEAHEIFAGIYKRYDRQGTYLDDSNKAKMAGRVRRLLEGTPVLLLTATPIQNSLAELWGLAQFVEPTGSLLGDLATFRALFTQGDDRHLAPGQEGELRRRLGEICQRTLRRQAQAFMKRPFVARRTRLFEYTMSPAERALYDEVSEYLLEPDLCAFRGHQRRLLLIGFHRRMASSIPALAASLDRVAERLVRMRDGECSGEDPAAMLMYDDLDEDELPPADDIDAGPEPSPEAIAAELDRVRGFAEHARRLPADAKANAFVRAVATVLDQGGGSAKLVVFTESIRTQDYLRDVLASSGLVSDDEITLFRGNNDGPRAEQALERWRAEALARLSKTAHPTREVAVRLALVHEFKTRGKVFIATEAGAKGLNLQFAGVLINYDLPWNPQRIEQRIGRIHRYGQTQDVLIINFVASDNEAHRLTLEILTEKLDLFGTVLGASDQILHEPTAAAPAMLADALGADFEQRLRRIYAQARDRDEIAAELVALRTSIADERARYEDTYRRTAGLIESRFDDQVKRVFRNIQERLPAELAAFDSDLERVVSAYLDAVGAAYRRCPGAAGVRLEVAPCKDLPVDLRDGFVAYLGDARDERDVEPLHLGHPLVQAALDETRAASAGVMAVALVAPTGLTVGGRGRLRLVRVRHEGYETFDELLPVALVAGDADPLIPELALELLLAPARTLPAMALELTDTDMDDAVEMRLFTTAANTSEREQTRFARAIEQIERGMEDRIMLLERRRGEMVGRVADAERARDAAIGAEARTRAEKMLAERAGQLARVESELDRLRRRDDADYARWIERAHRRRSRPPVVETLFDVCFELVNGDD